MRNFLREHQFELAVIGTVMVALFLIFLVGLAILAGFVLLIYGAIK